ncbi:hypothetical protein B0H10DRAFT_2001780 [Mycena sp. CBHHK59/15]|nr:hypothetical protein B0H10DRAFT_2001780 [Mycena sp. CBHHK59/15]
MAQIQGTEIEPGFGRRRHGDDSSSSRESSPNRKHKRSFSPTSDDEVVISIADDDTPPPEGPLIRQAVAFSWTPSTSTASTSINTYQASPIPKPGPSAMFLPGQSVPAPSVPPKPPKTKRKSNNTVDQFSSQTGRFRVSSYDPTPPVEPALTSGDGPYASMYRADAGTSSIGAASDGADVHGSLDGRLPETASTSRKRPKPSDSRPKASASKAKVSASKTKSSTSKSKSLSANQGPASAPSVPQAASETQEGSSHSPSYYRRDYEQGSAHASSANSHIHSFSANSPSPLQQPQSSKRISPPIRLVTILIEDVRGEDPDHQLAEVRVGLRDSENLEQDGFWANAEDICKTLQSSASRIDGPAKVYALRGKYRQIILRVTADNVDEWVNANVVVNPDRTLDVIVDAVLPARALPPPRQETSEQASFPSPRATTQLPYAAVGPPSDHGSSSRKRRHSPSDDHYRKPADPRQCSPSTLSSGTPSRAPSASHQNNYYFGSPDTRTMFPGHHPSQHDHGHPLPRYSDVRQADSDSSESDDDPDARHAKFINEVDQKIQQDSNWVLFFQATGKPRSVPAVLKEYRIVQGIMNNWVGKPVLSGRSIESFHIAEALRIEEDPKKYVRDCTETLELLALYGPEGQRLRHPEVVQMTEDSSDPAYNAKPIKKLLRLMRKINDDWVKAHPEDDCYLTGT